MSTAQNLREERLKKLKSIRELGWDPYPSSFERKNTIADARLMEGKAAKTAGRIMSLRTHGKIAFADLKDESGKIQIFFKQEQLGVEMFEHLNLLDIGDIIGVEGQVGKTVAGEISIIPDSYTMLTKTLSPLPNTWYGLKDVEERFRKRYLDLILNTEVKKRIEMRSKIIQSIRSFLNKDNFLEIETPTLQPIYGGGFAKPFVTHFNALNSDFYLRISDEMYLKRLIVGGYEKVYEITKVFRNEGYDSDHNPEFTMFEAQIAYQDYHYGMDIIEKIIEHAALMVHGKTEFDYQGTEMTLKRPWPRYSVTESIKKFTSVDPLDWKTLEEARIGAAKLISKQEKHSELAKMNTIGEIIAFTFEECVEEKLIQPTIIYDYPVEISPLAKKCPDPRFTQRFEMFAFGSELGNNYTELNDPIDLKKRFIEEKKRESAGFDEAHQTDDDYIEAIEHGFPPTCGIAIGIDRLVMLLTNAINIKEVIAFPTLKKINHDEAVVEKDLSEVATKTPEQKKSIPPVTNESKEPYSLSRDAAFTLVKEKLTSPHLVKHSLAVEAAMKGLAKHFGGNEARWGMVGLLHDIDWDATKDAPDQHTKQTVAWLKELGNSNVELHDAILSHNHLHNGEGKPETLMEWALYTCDELTGFIVARTLVLPTKKIVDVTVESVLKKFPSKSFAAGVNRLQIQMCEEKLGIKINDFVGIVLKSMQEIAIDLSM